MTAHRFLVAMACAAVVALPVVAALAADRAEKTSGPDKPAGPPRPVVVFQSGRTETTEGVVIRSTVEGDLDDETAQRVGRPWSYFDESVLYDEEAWASSTDGRTVEHGYRVLRTPNPSPRQSALALGMPEVGPPEIDPDLEAALRSAKPGDLLPLTIDVRNAPEWDIPLRPAGVARGAADLEAADTRRAVAMKRRRSRFADLFSPVVRHIEKVGGTVTAQGTLSGWLTARVPAAHVRGLLRRNDLRRVSLLRGRFVAHNWDLGVIRSDGFIDAKQFIDAGYDGEQPNPGRHAFGDITVGVIELDLLENEACFLYDGAGCTGTSRLQEMFRCDDFDRDGNYCEPVSDFRDTDENSTHPTLVAATILGDYRQGQGDPQPLGDPNWDPVSHHTALWENSATGMAPEARLIFFGQIADNDDDDGTTTGPSFADAYDDSIDRHVDITNSSWGWTTIGSNCSMTAVEPHEQEAENAFDDGILVVVSAGNPNRPFCAGDIGTVCSDDADCTAAGLNGPCNTDSVCADDPGTACSIDSDCAAAGVLGPCRANSSTCNVGSPADLPKSFTVNALNGSEPNCSGGYSNCRVDANYSANGGITATVNGVACSGCVTSVDIAAPNRNAMTTSGSGPYGTAGFTFAGTSAAAPVVAGAAALVKDWLLTSGETWVNSPGRLHTVMLAMGDRTDGSWSTTTTSKLTSNASKLYGMGRLKLRLFGAGSNMDPWAWHMRLQSFVPASGDLVYFPFSNPIPNGAEIVKCVLMQDEDMSEKTDISRVDLELRLTEPIAGACSASGITHFTRIDSGTEIKKMSAITSADATLAGRCLEVTLNKQHVTSAGVTTHAFCYYSGVLDNVQAPN